MVAQFDDGKDEGALRTIGEVSRALGIKTHVLRYWEQQFPALDPLKRSGGRRYYRPEDVALIEAIDRLVHREGYTIKGAQQVLAGGKGEALAATEPAPVAAPQTLDDPMPPAGGTVDPGGVGNFFGTAPAPATEAEPVSESGEGAAEALVAEAMDGANPPAPAIPREDMLARLRTIRAVLAEALAA